MKRVFKVNILFLVILILQIALALFGTPIFSKFLSLKMILILGSIIFIYMPAIIYIKVNKQSFRETLKLNNLGFKNALYCMLIFILLLPITMLCNVITSFYFKNNLPTFLQNTSSGSALIFFLMLAVMPAIGEELVMRGVILDGYKRINLHIAAFMNGLLFAVIHLNPPQFLYAFILGVVFVYLVTYTNSLFSSMLVHFLFNGTSALSFIFYTKFRHEDISKIVEKAQAINTPQLNQAFLVPFITLTLKSIIAILLIIVILRKLKHLNHYEERINFYEHTFDLNTDKDDDNFVTLNPKKSNLLAYLPILMSILLFLWIVIATLNH